jgi:pimeloyl-ACP methyl ester carboxylesterase
MPARRDAICATRRARPASPLHPLPFSRAAGRPTTAWTTIPSWYLVAGADKAVGTANERFMARRMHVTTAEAKGASHIVMLSQPDKVIGLILPAAAGRR